MTSSGAVSVRGFLIHITHYDPWWTKRKASEKPFDLDLGLELVDALAENGFNLLAIDCEDGVRYKSHPELKRHYTLPMSTLEKLATRARKAGLEVVPKTNFSLGPETHNMWFRPYDGLIDNEEYWNRSFQILDELIDACQPKRFVHVGMDEEYRRSYTQYIDAICTLHAGLKKRKLRPIVWNDTCLDYKYHHFVEKCMTAEKKIPHDVVEIPWCYWAVREDVLKRLVKAGFDVWAAPGEDPEQIRQWRDVVIRHGGKGLFFTRWVRCHKKNRSMLLKLIKTAGPIAAGRE